MIIRSEAEFNSLLSKIDKVDRWAVDTEGLVGIYPEGWSLVGVSISLDGRTGYYIPTGHDKGSQLSADYVVEKLKPYFLKKELLLYGANLKHDMKVFRLIDPSIEFREDNVFCTMTASFILDTNNKHGLKESAMREFDYKMLTLDDVGCPKIKDPNTKDKTYLCNQMDIEELSPYAIDDAVQTFRLGDLYRERIEEEDYAKVYYELEIPFMFILMELEESGIKIDKESLSKFMEDAPQKLETLDKEIQELLPVNDYVNVNSNQQLNPILFKKLKIKPRGEKTKTGYYSIKNDYLEVWNAEHEVCGKIAEYRKLRKLFGNFLSNLYYRLNNKSRLHSSFNRHVARTGRLSSSSPNLQNIPRLENDTYGMRKLFMAEEGYDLLVADFSQIELKIAAHSSKDKAMIEAFNSGADIHSATAKNVFKLECEVHEVKDKYPVFRQIAKSINFGLIYEAGSKTLTATANKAIENPEDRIDEEFMSKVIEDYFKVYPGIKKYIEVCHKKAEKHGYVKTLTGRRRYLPDAQIDTRGKNGKPDYDLLRRKFGAYRQASNTPVQGSAADIMAIAMRNIKRSRKEKGLDEHAKFVLQVHDEVVMEVKEEYSDQIAEIIKYEMENAVAISVPLTTDVQKGKAWGELK